MVDKMMDVQDVMALTGYSRPYVLREFRKNEKLKAKKMGRTQKSKWVVPQSALYSYLKLSGDFSCVEKDRMIKKTELAKLANVSPQTIEKLYRAKDIPNVVTWCDGWMISLKEACKWLGLKCTFSQDIENACEN